MKTREELIQYCKDQIKCYKDFEEHDNKIHNFQDAAEDKGRVDAYQDILIQLGVNPN